jgi:hypothetical protein
MLRLICKHRPVWNMQHRYDRPKDIWFLSFIIYFLQFYILSDSQAVIKALDNYRSTSKLVWDCHQSLMQLAEHNRVQLMWVPGHEGIDESEMADYLATCPFIGP